MKKITAILLTLVMVLATFSFTVMAEGENANLAQGEKNYAYGKSYAYAEDYPYLDRTADDGKILTDGVLPYAEESGKSVGITGSNKVVTITIDLGKSYSDISKVIINVRDSKAFNDGNRSFCRDKARIETSTNGSDFTAAKYTMEKEVWAEGDDMGYYNYIYNFSSDLKARYVKLTVYSDTWVLLMNEIQVVGGEAIVTEESSVAEEESSVAEGESSVAEEESSAAEEESSVAEGESSVAEGESSAAEGESSAAEESSEAPVAPTEVNYAAGKKYTIEGTLKYLDASKTDNGEMLTDGIIPTSETPFETVAFVGSKVTNTITINLGKKCTDINKIKFDGVVINGNRQFADVIIEVSNNGSSFTKLSADDYTYAEVETEVAKTFNIEYALAKDVTAKYVRVTLTSKEYVLTLGEIEVIGGGASGGEVDPGENENPGDAGFVVVALVAAISLAGAVIVSRRKFN